MNIEACHRGAVPEHGTNALPGRWPDETSPPPEHDAPARAPRDADEFADELEQGEDDEQDPPRQAP